MLMFMLMFMCMFMFVPDRKSITKSTSWTDDLVDLDDDPFSVCNANTGTDSDTVMLLLLFVVL